MTTTFEYEGKVKSDLDQLKSFLENAVLNLKEYICDEDTMFDLKLILDELMVNSLFHGNKKDSKKDISLSIRINDESVIIDIEDEGNGVDFDFDNYDFTSRSSSGRGLILVKALTDSLTFDKNRVTAVKKI